MKAGSFIVMLAVLGPFALSVMSAGEPSGTGQAPAAKAPGGPTVTLQAAISASEGLGKPISAKLEKMGDALELSVRTLKDGVFMMVIVDPETGEVAAADPIADKKDLVTLKAEGEAMGMAKVSLGEAVRKAITANKGFRAVDVSPAIVNGHPVAEVTLVRGKGSKKVVEALE